MPLFLSLIKKQNKTKTGVSIKWLRKTKELSKSKIPTKLRPIFLKFKNIQIRLKKFLKYSFGISLEDFNISR